MDEELYQKFYKVETIHWWFSARREIIYDFIINFIKLNNNSNILDYGCGTGGILEIISKKFQNIYGTDLSKSAIEFCKKRNLSNVFHLNDINLKNYNQFFDLITVLDVIEHIDDDIGTLVKLRKYLKSKGLVLITVPAYQFLFGPYDILTQHKRRYTKKHLSKIVTQSGYEIIKISYFNTFLSPLMILSRIISNFTGWNNDTNIPFSCLNSFLKFIFGIEKYFLRFFSFPFGISIICLAKKNE